MQFNVENNHGVIIVAHISLGSSFIHWLEQAANIKVGLHFVILRTIY